MEDGLAALLPPPHGKVAVALEDTGCGQKPYTTLIFQGKEGGKEGGTSAGSPTIWPTRDRLHLVVV